MRTHLDHLNVESPAPSDAQQAGWEVLVTSCRLSEIIDVVEPVLVQACTQ